ncbi:hypothetical protein [Chryseobacterium sp. 5_R23647]|uniref:hypothetical protein n=1 Tax=Chryseobacterium sp. 5_R23647 TaxID=2258964 RepID=UPI000F4F92A1|nr:hypothetical protein [Chryseobacterium sp. 5_R23647]
MSNLFYNALRVIKFLITSKTALISTGNNTENRHIPTIKIKLGMVTRLSNVNLIFDVGLDEFIQKKLLAYFQIYSF